MRLPDRQLRVDGSGCGVSLAGRGLCLRRGAGLMKKPLKSGPNGTAFSAAAVNHPSSPVDHHPPSVHGGHGQCTSRCLSIAHCLTMEELSLSPQLPSPKRCRSSEKRQRPGYQVNLDTKGLQGPHARSLSDVFVKN